MLRFRNMETPPKHSDWSKSFMYSLHETYFMTQKRLEQRLAHHDSLTFSQFLILLPLHCQTSASQHDIAEFLHLTEATVSRHVTGLVKDGYIIRHEVEGNRRKHILKLSKKGASAFEKAHTAIEEELQSIFNIIPPKDRKNISDSFDLVLEKLIA